MLNSYLQALSSVIAFCFCVSLCRAAVKDFPDLIGRGQFAAKVIELLPSQIADWKSQFPGTPLDQQAVFVSAIEASIAAHASFLTKLLKQTISVADQRGMVNLLHKCTPQLFHAGTWPTCKCFRPSVTPFFNSVAAYFFLCQARPRNVSSTS